MNTLVLVLKQTVFMCSITINTCTNGLCEELSISRSTQGKEMGMLIQNSIKGKMQVLIIIIIIIIIMMMMMMMMMMMITIFNQENTDELGKLITKVCMNN